MVQIILCEIFIDHHVKCHNRDSHSQGTGSSMVIVSGAIGAVALLLFLKNTGKCSANL